MSCSCSSETPLLECCNIYFPNYPDKIIVNRKCPMKTESLKKLFGTYCRFGYLEGQLKYVNKIFGKNNGMLELMFVCHSIIEDYNNRKKIREDIKSQ